MKTISSPFRFQSFFWLALLITLFRLIYLFVNHRELDTEESQYWVWSHYLAWGYHSKPPMISWVIHLSTWLFGNSEWAIRFFCPILYLLSACLMYCSGKELYDSKVGFWTGFTILCLPGVSYSSTILSTDPLLLLFWSGGLLCLIKARTSGWIWWILLGIAIGLGLLSKYTMLVFLLSAALYFIWVPKPVIFNKWGPGISLALATMIFLPNLLWNLQHHNAALDHVVNHNMSWSSQNLLHFDKLLSFLLGQVGILGPILAVFLVVAVLYRTKEERDPTLLLLCFTLPMLLLIMVQALISRAYANWAVAAYPSGVLLIVAYLCRKQFNGWLKASTVLNIIIALCLASWELAIANGYCSWPLAAHPSWEDLAKAVVQQHHTFPHTLYLVDDRELWSKLLYYGKISPDDLLIWDPDHNLDWLIDIKNSTKNTGADFIFVTYNHYLPNNMLGVPLKDFRRIDHIQVNQRLRSFPKDVNIFLVSGLQLANTHKN